MIYLVVYLGALYLKKEPYNKEFVNVTPKWKIGMWKPKLGPKIILAIKKVQRWP